MKLQKLFLSIGMILTLAGCSAGFDSSVVLPDEQNGNADIPTQEEVTKAAEEIKSSFGDPADETVLTFSQTVLSNYSHLDPKRVVPTKLLQNAVLYFDRNKASFKNQNYISIVDYSARSNMPRFFVVNMKTGAVDAYRTSHGVGSDANNDGYVEKLSNVSGSKMSTRGFFRVAEIYSGKYGRSIRLDGLSSTNSNTRARAIVVHGSDYVLESNVIQGRSWGCFVLAWSVKDKVVTQINGGSLMYAEKSSEI